MGKERVKHLGFPTANVDVTGLTLPPKGVYAVELIVHGKTYKGIANLGFAPTIKKSNSLNLEVHVFDFKGSLYNTSIEVIPIRYIRPEIHFPNIDALQKQIESDIAFLKALEL